MYESEDKMVSHPEHYMSKTGMEVIDVIEAFTDELKGIEATDTGNIIKYACRWKKKNGIQDLEKILWYAQHLIDHLKNICVHKQSTADCSRNSPCKFKSRKSAFLGKLTKASQSRTCAAIDCCIVN